MSRIKCFAQEHNTMSLARAGAPKPLDPGKREYIALLSCSPPSEQDPPASPDNRVFDEIQPLATASGNQRGRWRGRVTVWDEWKR